MMWKPVPSRTRFNRPRYSAFTLIEILIVLMVVAFLMATLGVTISNMLTSAREAQTIATLEKIDGLIAERQQGLERVYFKGRDFDRYVERFRERLLEGDPANGVPQLFGISAKAVEAGARKDFFRRAFPQRFAEMIDIRTGPAPGTPGADGIPDRIQFDDAYGQGIGTIVWNGATPLQQPTGHQPETESSELLYFALTRMSTYGVAPVGSDAFKTQEVADTDGDGLLEFVDGWGRPLRFYRWPTRLFKPYGLYGFDGVEGGPGDDDGDGTVNNIQEIGWPGTDDVSIPPKIRFAAGRYMSGLPRAPYLVGSPPVPVVGDYDQLNEDPDDSFGVLLFEAKRLTATGTPMLNAVSESQYHTLDTYHRPLVVSAGADGFLGLYEPFHNEDAGFQNGKLDPGEDANGNGFLDLGILGQLLHEDFNNDGILDPGEDINGNFELDTFDDPKAAYDDITNHNRQAGG